jgi:hypothetical protein
VDHTEFRSQNLVAFESRKLATGLFEVKVIVRTVVQTSEYVSSFSEVPGEVYDLLAGRLQAAVSSGSFVTELNARSTANGATGTSSVSGAEVTIPATPDYSSSSDGGDKDDDRISDGGIAGLVIMCVVVVAAVIAAVMWCSKGKEASGNSALASNVYSVDRELEARDVKDKQRPQSGDLDQITLNDVEGGAGRADKIVVVVEKNSPGDFSF